MPGTVKRKLLFDEFDALLDFHTNVIVSIVIGALIGIIVSIIAVMAAVNN